MALPGLFELLILAALLIPLLGIPVVVLAAVILVARRTRSPKDDD